ncbi:MAG: hypothetical protein K2M76_02470 [Muribaculaceae bacterium]|nr:hypothetical protein [Muribaculaceae bacterium]
MMEPCSGFTPDTLEQPCLTMQDKRRWSIGLPAATKGGESRFPLTPEGVELLVNKGLTVMMQKGASSPIHYSDAAYERAGAIVTDRIQALKCDMVISPGGLDEADVRHMRRGAMLLTLYYSVVESKSIVQALLERAIVCVAIDLVEDEDGHTPFADILHEIAGRASLAVASSLLTDPVYGKGILLSGIAGIVPCEVTILGSGIGACAAARAAMGLGVTVRMFDNDTYSLRESVRQLGRGVISSALHPHVLEGALRSADVVLATPMRTLYTVDASTAALMKRRVMCFDLNPCHGHVFQSLPHVNLSAGNDKVLAASSSQVCYTNVECRVPRTVAMALSNAFVTMMDGLQACGECLTASAILRQMPGVRHGVLTFMGKPMHESVARLVEMRCGDLGLFLTLS